MFLSSYYENEFLDRFFDFVSAQLDSYPDWQAAPPPKISNGGHIKARSSIWKGVILFLRLS